MSILIREMGIPKSCWVCPFRALGTCYFDYDISKALEEDTRADDCPIEDVVTCDNCEWFQRYEGDYWGVCGSSGVGMEPIGFCSDGERKCVGLDGA